LVGLIKPANLFVYLATSLALFMKLLAEVTLASDLLRQKKSRA